MTDEARTDDHPSLAGEDLLEKARFLLGFYVDDRVEDDGEEEKWTWIREMFSELESAFCGDDSDYPTQGERESPTDRKKRTDEHRIAKQRQLAQALWKLDCEVADQYEDVLRAYVPPGRTSADKGEGFLDQLKELRGHSLPLKNEANPNAASLESLHVKADNMEQGIGALRDRTEAIAKNDYDLRRENDELSDLAQKGFLRFAARVEADDFRAFAAIMITGNQHQAARELGIPSRTFYDQVAKWSEKGADYRRMKRMVGCLKKANRKIKLPLNDSLLGTEIKDQSENPETARDILENMRQKTDTANYEDVLHDILSAITRQDAENWQAVRDDVMDVLKDELPQ